MGNGKLEGDGLFDPWEIWSGGESWTQSIICFIARHETGRLDMEELKDKGRSVIRIPTCFLGDSCLWFPRECQEGKLGAAGVGGGDLCDLLEIGTARWVGAP